MKSRFLGFGFFILFTLLPFTNCSNYTNQSSVSGLSSLSCTTANCVTADQTILKITANTQNGEFDVPAGLSEFNIGGDCNEGGYPYNQVHWELWDQSGSSARPARTSSDPVANGASADSKCINGRFMIYVYLGAVSVDNVNRTGLKTPYTGGRGAYLLKIYLYARTSAADKNTQLSALTALPLSAY